MDEVLIDTNVLVYIHQTEEQFKRARSIEILEALDQNQRGTLSVQVLAEFVDVTTRGKRPALSIDEARTQVESLLRMLLYSI